MVLVCRVCRTNPGHCRLKAPASTRHKRITVRSLDTNGTVVSKVKGHGVDRLQLGRVYSSFLASSATLNGHPVWIYEVTAAERHGLQRGQVYNQVVRLSGPRITSSQFSLSIPSRE